MSNLDDEIVGDETVSPHDIKSDGCNSSTAFHCPIFDCNASYSQKDY